MCVESVLTVQDGQSFRVGLAADAQDGGVHRFPVGKVSVHVFWSRDDEEIGIYLVANLAWEGEEHRLRGRRRGLFPLGGGRLRRRGRHRGGGASTGTGI